MSDMREYLWDAEVITNDKDEDIEVIVPEGKVVDVTDPCYDKGTWCRTTVPLAPGTYKSFAVFSNEGVWGERVAASGICSDLMLRHASCACFEYVGTVGVDAGLMGYFVDKPDYSDSEWSAMIQEMRAYADAHDGKWPNVWDKDGGFITSSGYGDGGYPVYLIKNASGIAVGVMVVFIDLYTDEDDEEDEDDEDEEDE